MNMEKAHDLARERRTLDVSIDEDLTFSDMLLSEQTLRGLRDAGFLKPSPIQKKAIPYGRCGFDLIIQAKSGTGKTCVFSVITIEMLEATLEKLQAVILAPTREISVQIANVLASLSRGIGNVAIETFIGGLPFEHDKKKIAKCQIAVGTPGRVKHLITDGLMDLSAVRLLVLDEADRLMEESFINDISYIFSKLPLSKQMIAASATFSEKLEKFVAEFMKKPIKICPGDDVILRGVRQFAYFIPFHPSIITQMKNKIAALMKILSTTTFKQCVIFSNYQSWAETVCDKLVNEGWPAIYINSSQEQKQRLEAFSTFKQYRCRILLSTDLTSRGIDAENVNLVINLDLPYSASTYLHRIGRAGRYGTHAVAITLIQEDAETENFQKLLFEIGGPDFSVSIFPRGQRSTDVQEVKDDRFEKLPSKSGEYNYLNKMECDEEPPQIDGFECGERANDTGTDSLPSDRRLNPPQSPNLDNWETLMNDLSAFELEEPGNPPSRDDVEDVTEAPPDILSGLIELEKNGWKSFNKKLELLKLEYATELVDDEDIETSEGPSSTDEGSCTSDENNKMRNNEDSQNENDTDIEESTTDSEDSSTDSESSDSEESSEYEDEDEDEDEDENENEDEDEDDEDEDEDEDEDDEDEDEDGGRDGNGDVDGEEQENEEEDEDEDGDEDGGRGAGGNGDGNRNEDETARKYKNKIGDAELQKWYALYMSQSKVLANYVSLCRYWTMVNNK